MSFRTGTGLIIVFVLITMMVCPAISAVQSNKAKGHCSSEQPQDHEQNMRGCCDQNALSIQQVHAPCETPVQLVVLHLKAANSHTGCAFEPVRLPYQKTRDHLSKLSTLRL